MYRNGYVGLLLMNLPLLLNPWSSWEFSQPNSFLYVQRQPPEVFCKKGVLKKISQNSHESTCARVSFFNEVTG